MVAGELHPGMAPSSNRMKHSALRDDPPGDPAEVPGLDQSGLDAAGLEEVAGPADVDMAGPDEADLAAEAAMEGVVLDDLGDLADVDGVEVVGVDLAEEDKDGTHAVAGDLGDALTAGPLAAAGTPGVSAPGEPAPAAGGGAAGEQAGLARTGAGEGQDEAFVYGDNDNALPAAQVASAGATADPVKY